MNYPRIGLTEIDLHGLAPCKITLRRYGKQDHSRWVLRGAEDGKPGALYYKIWNPSFVRRDNILAAIESGFYDQRTVPALQAIVFHKGVCRGYVMNEGELRPDAYSDEFRTLVCARTLETGYFFVQLGANHTMVYQGRRSLLNIDSAYPLDAFPRLPEYRCHMADRAYGKFVAGLYSQSLGKSGTDAETVPDPGIAAMPPSRGIVQRFWRRRSRRMMRGIRNHLPRLDLIQH